MNLYDDKFIQYIHDVYCLLFIITTSLLSIIVIIMKSLLDTKEQVDIPLLDEFAEILEKEKTLMSLKLLEQKMETDEWKKKYELNIDKVRGNMVDGLKGGPIVINMGSEKGSVAKTRDFSTVLLSLHNEKTTKINQAVFSNINLNKDKIKLIMDHLKLSSYISSLVLSHCYLNDDQAQELVLLVTKKEIRSLDLSLNQLGERFISTLLPATRGRSSNAAPQYLLLHGNMPLSSVASFPSAIFSICGRSTWGLTLTLMDSAIFSKNLPSAAAAGDKDTKSKNDELFTNVESALPKLCTAFLNQLNSILENSQLGKPAIKDLPKKKKDTPSRPVAPVAEACLRDLSVLGLMHSSLGKESFKLLKVHFVFDVFHLLLIIFDYIYI